MSPSRGHAVLVCFIGALGLAALGACSSTPPPADVPAQDAVEGGAPMDAPVRADAADSALAPDVPGDAGACQDFSGSWAWTGSCSGTGATVDPFTCIAQTGCATQEFAGRPPAGGTVVGNVLSFDVPTASGAGHCTYTLNGDNIAAHCDFTRPAFTCDVVGVRGTFPGATSYCCDPDARACGAGQRCQYTSNQANPVAAYTACIPAGALAEGAACVREGGRTGADECGAGLTCANFGQPSATQRICQRLCTDAGSCHPGEVCRVLPGTVQAGVCRPACTPFGNDCVAGTGCKTTVTYEAAHIPGDPPQTQPVCVLSGTTADGARCTDNVECGAASECIGDGTGTAYCRPLCDPMHPCAAGATCSLINPGLPNPSNLSFCRPN